MKKPFLFSLTVTLVIVQFVCINSLRTFARAQQYDDIFSSKQFYDKEELKEVMRSALESSPVARGICSAEELQKGHAYKVCLYSDGLFAEDMNSGKKLQKMLSSSEYAWVIDLDGVTLWMDKINGKWKATSCSENPADNSGTIDFDAAERAIIMLKNEFGAKDISVQCLYSRNYFGRYMIFYSSVGEYVVPFCYRPDFTGLENGKLYPAAELAEILVKNLPADPTNWFSEEANAVSPTAKKHPVDFGNVAMYLSITLVPLAMGIGVILYRKKKVCRS